MSTSCDAMSCHMLKDCLIPTRTVEESFWTLWRHHYDVIVSRDVTGCLPTVWVKKIPSEVFWHFFPNGWEFLVRILHAYYMFLSTLDYKFLFNYLQFWRSYAILSASTQFTSYAQCPSSAETHAFRYLRKSLITLLIVVCGKSSQICCSALFSSGDGLFLWLKLWNAWSITHHTW